MFSALRISAFLSLFMAIFAAATPAPQSSELEQRDEGSLEKRFPGPFPYCWQSDPWPQPGQQWCGYRWGNIPWWSIPWDQIPFQYVPWGGIEWYGARSPWCPWNPARVCFPPGPPRPAPTPAPAPPPPPPFPFGLLGPLFGQPTATVFVTVTAGATSTITSALPQRTFPPGFIPGAAPPV
ncbi:hypothetical protein PENSPDRAFT_747620 [Peniophora sp. CONT]|nr:hypothetical protein PENSPDRAFT_747620 [Peniophora sp. CONT]